MAPIIEYGGTCIGVVGMTSILETKRKKDREIIVVYPGGQLPDTARAIRELDNGREINFLEIRSSKKFPGSVINPEGTPVKHFRRKRKMKVEFFPTF